MKLFKIFLKKREFFIILIGLVLFLFFTYQYNLKKLISNDKKSQNSELLLSQNNKSNLPVFLKIPSLNISSMIESVGLTSDGAVDDPKSPSNVAWYNLGPYPGEKGNAIIDGHSGWKNGIPAIFDNLYKIKKGDKIYVEDQNGVVITFVVIKISSYDPDLEAQDVFISNDEKAHLNLITCGGTWDKILKAHSSRIVVFTDMEE